MTFSSKTSETLSQTFILKVPSQVGGILRGTQEVSPTNRSLTSPLATDTDTVVGRKTLYPRSCSFKTTPFLTSPRTCRSMPSPSSSCSIAMRSSCQMVMEMGIPFPSSRSGGISCPKTITDRESARPIRLGVSGGIPLMETVISAIKGYNVTIMRSTTLLKVCLWQGSARVTT